MIKGYRFRRQSVTGYMVLQVCREVRTFNRVRAMGGMSPWMMVDQWRDATIREAMELELSLEKNKVTE